MPWFFAAFIFLAALLIRFWNVTAESAGFEEIAASLAAVRDPLTYLRTARLEHAPALYYALLYPVAAFGGGHLGLMRLPSIIAGALACMLLYLLFRRMIGERAAILASVFLAINPLHIYFSQEAQSAALFTLVSVLAFYFMLRTSETNRLWHWILFDLCAIGMLHLHMDALFVIGAFLLIHAIRVLIVRDVDAHRSFRQSRLLGTILFNYALIIGLSLPWLYTVPTRLPWLEIQPDWRELLSLFYHAQLFGVLGRMPLSLYAAAAILFALVLPPLLKIVRGGDFLLISVVAALLLIVLLPFGYSYIGRVRFGAERTGILAAPFFALSLGVLLARCNVYVRAGLFGLFAAIFMFSVVRIGLTRQKVAYEEAANAIARNAQESDVIVFWPDYTTIIGEYFFGRKFELASATDLFEKWGDDRGLDRVFFLISHFPDKEPHPYTFSGALRHYAESRELWRQGLNAVIQASDLDMFRLQLWYDEPQTLNVLDAAIPDVTQFIFTAADPIFRNDQLHTKAPDISYELNGRRVVWTKTPYVDLELPVTLSPGNYVLKLHVSPIYDHPQLEEPIQRAVNLEVRTGEKVRTVKLEKEATIRVSFDTHVELKKLPVHIETGPLLKVHTPRELELGVKIYSIAIDLEPRQAVSP